MYFKCVFVVKNSEKPTQKQLLMPCDDCSEPLVLELVLHMRIKKQQKIKTHQEEMETTIISWKFWSNKYR